MTFAFYQQFNISKCVERYESDKKIVWRLTGKLFSTHFTICGHLSPILEDIEWLWEIWVIFIYYVVRCYDSVQQFCYISVSLTSKLFDLFIYLLIIDIKFSIVFVTCHILNCNIYIELINDCSEREDNA